MQRRKEHNQDRKYGNEPLTQEHNPAFPTVLSFQLLAETEGTEFMQRQAKDCTPDFTSSPTPPVELATGTLEQGNVP